MFTILLLARPTFTFARTKYIITRRGARLHLRGQHAPVGIEKQKVQRLAVSVVIITGGRTDGVFLKTNTIIDCYAKTTSKNTPLETRELCVERKYRGNCGHGNVSNIVYCFLLAKRTTVGANRTFHGHHSENKKQTRPINVRKLNRETRLTLRPIYI